jgi:membrane protease YdiL (CAAX protease family)
VQLTIAVAGLFAEGVGWWLVSSRGRDVWRVMPVVLAAMGVAAVLVRPPVAASEVPAGVALVVGIGSGVALYVATRVFVRIASRVDAFDRATAGIYDEARKVSLARSLVLSLAVMVPGEEVFLRGLVQPRLSEIARLGPGLAAILTWAAYVVVNVASRRLPIVLGAIVGGALWAALWWWSGGLLASLASHIIWTGAMLVLPPGAGRRRRPIARRKEPA